MNSNILSFSGGYMNSNILSFIVLGVFALSSVSQAGDRNTTFDGNCHFSMGTHMDLNGETLMVDVSDCTGPDLVVETSSGAKTLGSDIKRLKFQLLYAALGSKEPRAAHELDLISKYLFANQRTARLHIKFDGSARYWDRFDPAALNILLPVQGNDFDLLPVD